MATLLLAPGPISSSSIQKYTQCFRIGGHKDIFVFTISTPTYYMSLESLWPKECSDRVFQIFGHNLGDQEASKGPKQPKNGYFTNKI